MVLKGSEVSPRVMHAITSVFNDAGLPKGVLNLVSTNRANAPAVTEALIAHPSVKKINFTGSTAIGRIVGKLAGQYLKPIVLELGGKAPAIVWDDANLDLAAEQCSSGAFLNSGQICSKYIVYLIFVTYLSLYQFSIFANRDSEMAPSIATLTLDIIVSTERIIVPKKISEAFQSKLRETVSKKWSGAQVHISPQAVEKNKRLVQDAASKGASVLYGQIDGEESTNTHLKPVIVTGITPKMEIYKEESFGATVSLLEVESEEEALRIANDTEYGLSSAVFTEDLRTGFRFAKNIETGAVHINNMSVHDEAALPHGGAKASGYGRFNASAGLEEYFRTKTVTWRN